MTELLFADLEKTVQKVQVWDESRSPLSTTVGVSCPLYTQGAVRVESLKFMEFVVQERILGWQ